MRDRFANSEATSLEGKVVLIAGGCQDISEAAARLFAKCGAEGLLIGGRYAERGQAVAAIVSAAGCPAEFLPTDFTKLEDCAALIAEADKVFGRIDVLIITAGMVAPRTGVEQLADYFDQLVAVNQRAPFFLMLRAAELIQRHQRPGLMVTVLGMQGEGEPLPLAAYEASQGALAAITRSFAVGLVDYQIRVLGLDLGGCEALVDSPIASGPAQAARSAHPCLKPQEIAAALALLAADPEQPPAGTIVPIEELLPAAALPGRAATAAARCLTPHPGGTASACARSDRGGAGQPARQALRWPSDRDGCGRCRGRASRWRHRCAPRPRSGRARRPPPGPRPTPASRRPRLTRPTPSAPGTSIRATPSPSNTRRCPAHQFLAERDRAFDPATPTGLIALDLSERLGTGFPATTPLMLTRYARIRAGERLTTRFKASGELYYVFEGERRRRSRARTASPGARATFSACRAAARPPTSRAPRMPCSG